MKHVQIRDLQHRLEQLLAYLRRGGTVRIFDCDQPIADLTPCAIASTDGAGERTLEALQRDGLIRRGKGTLPAGFLTRRLPKARNSVLKALLDERRNAR